MRFCIEVRVQPQKLHLDEGHYSSVCRDLLKHFVMLRLEEMPTFKFLLNSLSRCLPGGGHLLRDTIGAQWLVSTYGQLNYRKVDENRLLIEMIGQNVILESGYS